MLVFRFLCFVLVMGFMGSAFAQQKCQLENIELSAPTERFVVQDGVATDKETGLMWQRCFVGKSGDNCQEGELKEFSWPSALQYVTAFNAAEGFQGYKDWRLPNIRELVSIGEIACVQPALNLAIFPSAPSKRTWSASPYKFYPHYSWFVEFSDLRTSHLERFKKYPILLVRDTLKQ